MRFLKGFSITLSTQGIIQIAGFLNGIVIARYLGPAGRGEYAMVILLITILTVILGEGMHRSNVFLVGRDKSEQNLSSISSDIILYVILACLLLSCLALFPRSWFEFVLPGVGQPHIYLGLAIAMLFIVIRQFQGIYQGLQQFWHYNLLSSLPIVLFLAFDLIVLAATSDLKLHQVLVNFLLAKLISVLVASIAYYRRHNFSLPKSFEKTFKNLNVNLRATIAYLVIFLMIKTNLYVLLQMEDKDQVGLFAIASGIVAIIQQIPNVAGTVLFPKISDSNATFKLALTNKVATIIFAALVLFGLVLLLIGRELIVFLYSDQFILSYEPLVWLLPGAIAFGFASIHNSSLWGRGFPAITIWSPFVAFIVNIVCCLWLIPINGIVGAAQAATISFLVFSVITVGYVFFKRKALSV
jgi:O-antigen/teichoic acid export membrane protein